MSENCKCSCSCENSCPTLLYACSGAANTGFLADNVARTLMKDDSGQMTCLAAVGAGLSGFIASAKGANNIVIDGCPVGCGKKIFEDNSLPYTQIVLTELGVEKGKTEITADVIREISGKVKEKVS